MGLVACRKEFCRLLQVLFKGWGVVPNGRLLLERGNVLSKI